MNGKIIKSGGPELAIELENKGYEVIRNPFSYGFAGVHGIRIKNGIWDGGADPGRDGMVLYI